MTDLNESTSIKPPTWFWVVAGLATLWNAFGVFAYIGQVTMSDEALAALPEAQQALYHDLPAWVTSAFAIAVFAGLLGCVALLLRKKWATPVLIVSALAVVANTIYNLFLSDMVEVMGSSSIIMPIVIFLIAAGLIWFSKMSDRNGWLS